jgi:hypothetical protein
MKKTNVRDPNDDKGMLRSYKYGKNMTEVIFPSFYQI